MVLNSLLSWWEMHAQNYTLPFQGEPEIKYLLQGRMPGKESLFAKPSRPLDISLE